VRETCGAVAETGSGVLAGMRVLAVMPSIPLQGMERANIQIMRLVRERGAHVLFVTEATYGQRVQAAVEDSGCASTSVPVLRNFEERLHLTWRPRETLRVANAWARAARRLGAICREYRPTHIYVTNFTFFLYALPAIARARVPVVFRLPNPPGIEGRGIRRAVRASLWKLVVAMSDMIVCNSQYSLERLRALRLAPRRARVIYNCVPERRPGGGDAPAVDMGRFNVAYLGRIRPEKGVGELFEAAVRITREFPHVDFLLAGEYAWRNEFAASLRDRIGQARLEGRVRLLGEIEDVPGLLDRSHLHVCPSRSEGESFPNVVLEAKSRGVPSVVFPAGGLPEAVTHLVDGYVCVAPTSNALATGIQFFIEHEPARLAMGRAAERSLDRYARDVIRAQWAEVFQAVDRGGGPRVPTA
jgi:glycosyltransferase involved in cell wall biosynthesis